MSNKNTYRVVRVVTTRFWTKRVMKLDFRTLVKIILSLKLQLFVNRSFVSPIQILDYSFFNIKTDLFFQIIYTCQYMKDFEVNYCCLIKFVNCHL